MTYQEQFDELVDRYIIERGKDYSTQSKEERKRTRAFYESIYPQIEEIQKMVPDFVLHQLEANLTKLNIWVLHLLVDFVRAGCSPSAKLEKTIEVLLKLCFKVLEFYEELEENDPLFFISQTYETIWHAGLDDDPEDLYQLYFDLTCALLSDKYFALDHEHNQNRYRDSVVYWIMMSDQHFTRDKEDFQVIFDRLKKNPLVDDDPLLEYWQEFLEEINNGL